MRRIVSVGFLFIRILVTCEVLLGPLWFVWGEELGGVRGESPFCKVLD